MPAPPLPASTKIFRSIHETQECVGIYQKFSIIDKLVIQYALRYLRHIFLCIFPLPRPLPPPRCLGAYMELRNESEYVINLLLMINELFNMPSAICGVYVCVSARSSARCLHQDNQEHTRNTGMNRNMFKTYY
jgi:hypothetical protein